tara:strand:- start:91 stop:396 length:306 start_codon:yes stop_codon:yes gene_type:complete
LVIIINNKGVIKMFIGEVEQFWLISNSNSYSLDGNLLATSKKEAFLKAKKIVMEEYELVDDAEIHFKEYSRHETIKFIVGDRDNGEEWEFSGIEIKPIDLA